MPKKSTAKFSRKRSLNLMIEMDDRLQALSQAMNIDVTDIIRQMVARLLPVFEQDYLPKQNAGQAESAKRS